jgi:polyhydroxybutyrate depolymerase
VERWTYEGCDDGIDVELYSVEGGGHTWPGSAIEIGPTTKTVDATKIALDFFDSHPLPADR